MKRPFQPAQMAEPVLFQNVENGDRAFMFDIGIAPDHRPLIERQAGNPRLGIGGRVGHPRPGNRIAMESAWASRPSASAKVIAAGPIAASPAGAHPSIVVRLAKSVTPSPDPNSAARRARGA